MCYQQISVVWGIKCYNKPMQRKLTAYREYFFKLSRLSIDKFRLNEFESA